MNHLKRFLYLTAAASVVPVVLSHAQKAAPAAPAGYVASTEWPTYGHDSGGMRFSPLKQITPANVGTLEIAWVYHLKPEGYVAPARAGRAGAAGRGGAARDAGEARRADVARATGFNSSEGTPLIVGGLMYIASPYGRVVALNPTTGKEVWVYQLPSGNPSTRGVEYFAGDAQTPPLHRRRHLRLEAVHARREDRRAEHEIRRQRLRDPGQVADVAVDRLQEPDHHRRPSGRGKRPGQAGRRAWPTTSTTASWRGPSTRSRKRANPTSAPAGTETARTSGRASTSGAS